MQLLAAVPNRYVGKAVGNGHCVALVREIAPAPPTSQWRRGVPAKGSGLAAGTLIATFDGEGRYTNASDGSSHAAVFLGETEDGLLVIDQWKGRPVQRRLIRWRGGQGAAVDDGDRFHAIDI